MRQQKKQIKNLDFSKDVKAVVKLPKYTKKNELLPIKITDMPKLKHGKIYANLKAGETIVLIFKQYLIASQIQVYLRPHGCLQQIQNQGMLD